MKTHEICDIDPLIDLINKLPLKYRSLGYEIAKKAVDVYAQRVHDDWFNDEKDV